MKSFGSFGDFGDVVFLMPSIRAVAQQSGEPVIFYGMNGLRLHDPFIPRLPILAPLLESQDYIEAVLPWNGEPLDYDASHFRRAGHPFGRTLCDLQASWINLQPDCESPWLKISNTPMLENRIVIARSPRYQNPHFPWAGIVKTFAPHIQFVGHPQEHAEFCGEYGFVEYVPTKDLLELAQVIASSALFIGNQSCPNSIAEGLKHNSILEVGLESPDCLYRRNNAKHCYDGRLEFEFLGHTFESPAYVLKARAHLGETPPNGWRVQLHGHMVTGYALEAVLNGIKMNLLEDGWPIPPDLREQVIEQSSVDMPPPPPMAPILRLQSLLG